MARDITKLHPRLQALVGELIFRCKQEGIDIKIGECVRTVAEQDAIYAQGRTTPGKVVSNAKGSTYSSMHQWGIAFDFYLDEDVDKDGKTSDDAFNNSTALFDKVGKIGKSIGLEWGGNWSKPDRPHFQLPDWGSTPSKLKQLYGTPAKFMATWNEKPVKKSNPYTKPTRTLYYDKEDKQVVCTGYDVKWLQFELGISTDGSFGPATDKAVRKFQEEHNLEVDGRAGSKTIAALVAEV
jgi:peptidoglycan L-alanyl-D-glutamate endopeptidase CwlK